MNTRHVILACIFAALASSTAKCDHYTIKAGSTDQTVFVTLYADGDPATSGGPFLATGVAYNNATLKVYYIRPGESLQQIALQSQTVTGTHTDGGWAEINSTNAPGRYRLDLPAGVVQTGKPRARVIVSYGYVHYDIDIDLVGYDPNDSVRMGLTSLPNASAGANGGLPTVDANNAVKVQSGTGANQISLSNGLVRLSATGVDDIWDEGSGGHSTTGTYGWILTTGGVPLTSTAQSLMADAVWDEATSGHATSGTFGWTLTTGGVAIVSGGITSAKFATDAITAAALASDASTEIIGQTSGTADSGTTTTLVDAALTQTDTDYWAGSWLLCTSGNTSGQIRRISAFNPTTDTLTFSGPFTQAISTNNYIILRTAGADVNVTQWLGTGVSTNVAGTPKVDVTHVLGSPVCN